MRAHLSTEGMSEDIRFLTRAVCKTIVLEYPLTIGPVYHTGYGIRKKVKHEANVGSAPNEPV